MKRLDEALSYIEFGWPVFPLKGKVPLTARGFKDATMNGTVIEEHWTRHPAANIGVRTGSGLVVLDVDDWNTVHDLDLELPSTASSVTGGGGAHFYYQTDKYLPSRNGVFPGIDVKGAGGYVVAPSSTHSSGRRYEWDNPPDETDLAPAPAWLLDKLAVRRPAKRIPDVIPESERNVTLTSLGGLLARKGLNEREILIALSAVSERCEGQFSSKEVAKVARSVARYDAHPWALDPWSYAGRVVAHYGLGLSARLVLAELYRFADDGAVAFVGQRQLAKLTTQHQETVGNALKELEAYGLLRREGRGRGKRPLTKLTPTPLPSAPSLLSGGLM